MATEQVHRTLICSIVFLDIVGYSKQPVSRQLVLKDAFNTHIADSIKHIAEIDRVILDTGDGASICFMGDPEDALFSAITLRDAFYRATIGELPDLMVRIGINLGPIKQVQDLNGQRNILGDGINVAQRVMSFADPNQILVSRSYYEVVSCMSQEFSTLFHYLGARADKHVREHVVYEVRLAGASSASGKEAPADAGSGSTESAVAEPAMPEVGQLVATDRAGPGISLDAAQLEQARLALARHIGPLAGMIVTRAVTKARDLDHFYSLLAEQIDDPRERAQFLQARQDAAPTETPAAALTTAQGATPVGIGRNTPAYALIEREFSQALGPMAKLILMREAPRASSLVHLCQTLAQHIDEPAARAAFVKTISH